MREPPDPLITMTGDPSRTTIVGVMLETGRAPPRGAFGPGETPNFAAFSGSVKSDNSSFKSTPDAGARTLDPKGPFTVVVSATTLPFASATTSALVPGSRNAKRTGACVRSDPIFAPPTFTRPTKPPSPLPTA